MEGRRSRCDSNGAERRNPGKPDLPNGREPPESHVYSTDYGWGLFREKESVKNSERYHRTYTWNEKNQLVSTSDARYTVNYVYGQDGQRAAKYTAQSETLYFNKMWSLHTDGGNSHLGGEYAKNVYLGETRIVTKLVSANEIRAWEEVNKIYFYHSDHLGSASLITDENGNEYQRIEYTPYGEVWVDKYSQIQESTALLPYKFTGKERDEETGLYYYGARYLDAKYSRWISTDPALGEYMSGSKAGMGGAYNSVNLSLYHYSGNNPVTYTDPDGQIVETAWDVFSLVTGVASFVENVKEGNVKGAIIDGLGIVADAAAVAIPCIPGGAGAAIKAAKVASAVANVAGGALAAQDGLANGDYLEATTGALQAVSGVSSLSKVTKAADKISEAAGAAKSARPNQVHHFATNKNSQYTEKMAKIADKYGLKLDGKDAGWNMESLPHQGRHPNAYHDFVLDGMKKADAEAEGSVDKFKALFEKYVKEPVRNNPELLRKSGWE